MRFVQAGVLLLGAALYILFLAITGNVGSVADVDLFMNVALWTLVGWNALMLVVTVLVIIDSVKKVRAGKTAQLASGVVVVKLALIPFFLINFILLALVGLVGLVLSIRMIGLPLLFVVAIAIVLTYLAMVSTSVYGWASVVALRRERRISWPGAIVYSILLLIYLADIVAGIILFARAGEARAFRRRIWLPLVVALLATLLVLAVPGYLFGDLHIAWLSDIFLLAAGVTVVVTGVWLWVLRRRGAKAVAADAVETVQVEPARSESG